MEKVKNFLSRHFKTLIFFAVMGLVGGFLVGLYALDGYSDEIKAMLISELESAGLGSLSPELVMGVIAALQSLGYGVFLGAFGIYFAEKVGLFTGEISIKKKPLITAVVISVLAGALMIASDVFFFGKFSEVIMDSYAEKPGIVYMLATVTYGAVIEEVMLRLFLLSGVALLLHKLFGKSGEVPNDGVFIAANVISAMLFAAGHLPTTFMMLGNSPLLIFRCFLLNGGLGLAIGYLYRKHGLRYAMIAHAGMHIVSKLIWILFI